MCCQLGAEFTLLEKLAAGSNFFFFSVWMSSENKLALTGFLVHVVPEKDIILAKVRNCKTTYMQKQSWQMEWKMWDVVALFKGSGLCFIQFFLSINHESFVAQMAFSFHSNEIINFNESKCHQMHVVASGLNSSYLKVSLQIITWQSVTVSKAKWKMRPRDLSTLRIFILPI